MKSSGNGTNPELDLSEGVGEEPVDPVVADLRGRVTELEKERASVKDYIARLDDQIRRYDRAINALTGKVARPRPKVHSAVRSRGPGAGISEDRFEEAKAGVLEYAKERDEFRQIDFRSWFTGFPMNSGTSSSLFERLRQDGVVRLARVEGNSKFYRLTREALNA